MRAPVQLATLAACVACAREPLPAARFVNAPPVAVVDDREDVPRPPKETETNVTLYFFDGFFHRRITRAMELPRPQRARGVNALDKVPDSTWFTNRIGLGEVTPDDIRTGPTEIGNPEDHTPWTVESSKAGGESEGFIMRDARGERFLVKFDRLGFPEVETAAHVIVNRLLWGAGYHVPEDHIAFIHPHDIRVDERSTYTLLTGAEKPLTSEILRERLDLVEHEADGRIRVMASRILPGRALGGHANEGVRLDDPNDRIPHELRRDLRGARTLFSWLDHVDVKETNSLDVWVEDPARPGRHIVWHYFIDFGKSLGTLGMIGGDARVGHQYKVDFAQMGAQMVMLGNAPRPWGDWQGPGLRGVGRFDLAHYDPRAWQPYSPSYTPLMNADRYDQFWAATLLVRFTPAHIRAAVDAARLSDPASADYLTRTLIARQRAVLENAFADVNPLDGFHVAIDRGRAALCFEDLARTARIESGPTAYRLQSYDRAGRRLGTARQAAVGEDPRACLLPVTLAGDRDNYTIVRVTTERRGQPQRSTLVHLARDPGTNRPRVIGIWRE